MISVKNLKKIYGDIVAVDGISFNVEKGEIFSLLGPNGAGKTTTIKALLGLIKIDDGEIRINGIDVFSNGKKTKENIGYVPERASFYDNLTALQTLKFFSELKGVDEDCMALLKEFDLEKDANRKVVNFSKGMIQRLAIAQCLIGKPKLLILDEPTMGLDAVGAYKVREKIRELNENGITIFFSSHILSEVQEISHRVAILNKGKIIAIDTIENLGKMLEVHPKLRIELQRPSSYILNVVKNVRGVEDVKMEKNIIEIICSPNAKTNVIKAIEEAGGKIIDFKTVEPSLEEIFMKMVRE